MTAFFVASSASFPLLRDSAQPALFQERTPNLGRSHCVKNRYPISNAINHTHSAGRQRSNICFPFADYSIERRTDLRMLKEKTVFCSNASACSTLASSPR